MVKKLSEIGDGLGLVIERPILELLDITKETRLEIKTDGQTLFIRPMAEGTELDRVMSAAEELMDAHDDTYRALAK